MLQTNDPGGTEELYQVRSTASMGYGVLVVPFAAVVVVKGDGQRLPHALWMNEETRKEE